MTVMYNAEELGTCGTIFKWRGSMLAMVLKLKIFWILLFIHLSVLITRHVLDSVAPHVTLPTLEWKSVGLLTGLLTFFIVFYGSQSYARMTMFYGHCVALGGACMNWAALVRISCPEDPAVQWNNVRLILASMHVMYYLLNEDEAGTNQLSEAEWTTIRTRQLLTDDEIATVKDFKGFAPFLPLIWALKEVEEALVDAAADATDDPKRAALEKYRLSDLLSNFRELAFSFRGSCGQLTNWLKQPVPFPYYQFLTMLLLLDMLLVAYGLVTMNFDPVLTAVIFVTILTAFLGLKQVAVAMSDPFGEDAIDFDVEAMLQGAYSNAVAILHDERTTCGANLHSLCVPAAPSATAPRRSLEIGVTRLSDGRKQLASKKKSVKESPALPLVHDYQSQSSASGHMVGDASAI